jgi:hypothetical protein
MFDGRITIAKLGPTINEYQNSRKELIENIQYCTDDITGLTGDINDNKIGNMYDNLQGKYSGYKQYSDERYRYIHNKVRTINDTGIDDVQQQDATRTLFRDIGDKCTAFAKWVTDRMSEINVEVQDFVGAVDTYVGSTIPLLRKRLIACINRSADKESKDFDVEFQKMNFATLQHLFATEGENIRGIKELLAELDELAQLEADGP